MLFSKNISISYCIFSYYAFYAYKSNGFIQTAINQIVDDAFRNQGMIIDSETLDSDELEV